MSSPETRIGGNGLLLRRLMMGGVSVVLFALSLSLAGCAGSGFRPLYGAVDGSPGVAAELAAIDVSTIPGRVGQRIRNELLFRTGADDLAVAPRYRLDVAIRESVETILVKIDGDAKGQVYNLEADFKLIDLATNKVAFSGRSKSRAAFQRFDSIFANTRARRDAEDRAARDVGRNIRTRIAAHISRAV